MQPWKWTKSPGRGYKQEREGHSGSPKDYANHQVEETEKIIQPGGDGNHGSRKSPGRQANSAEKCGEAIVHLAVVTTPRTSGLGGSSPGGRKEGSEARPRGWQQTWAEGVPESGAPQKDHVFPREEGADLSPPG